MLPALRNGAALDPRGGPRQPGGVLGAGDVDALRGDHCRAMRRHAIAPGVVACGVAVSIAGGTSKPYLSYERCSAMPWCWKWSPALRPLA